MLAYTDNPHFADSLLEAHHDWVAPTSLPRASGAGDLLLRQALLPDRPVLATLLPDERLWTRLVLVEKAVGSQLDTLAESCAGPPGPPDGTLCLAGSGSGFHGQRDRTWSAVPGNLHLSAYLAAGLPAELTSAGCTVLPALAALDCVDETLGGSGRAGIKWVNDILVEGRKVAGVLTRTRCRGDRITDLIPGIGINVETSPPVERDPFVPGVACLRELASDPVRCTLARAWRVLARALERRYLALREGRVAHLVEDYRRRSVVIGRQVRIFADPAEGGGDHLLARGRVAGIDDDLGLHLEDQPSPLTHGRLVLDD